MIPSFNVSNSVLKCTSVSCVYSFKYQAQFMLIIIMIQMCQILPNESFLFTARWQIDASYKNKNIKLQYIAVWYFVA